MFGLVKKRIDSRQVIGVSVADGGVAFVRLARTRNNAAQILGCDFQSMASGQQLDKVLESWVRQYDLRNEPVNLVIDHNQFGFHLTEAPDVKDEELKAAMAFRAGEIIDMDIDSAVIDCFSIPGQKDRGRQPMAYVVSASKQVIKNYIDAAEGSHLQLRSIDIPALAQRNVAHLLQEDEMGVAMLSLQRQSGLLTLTRQGDLYLARDLDVGLVNFRQQSVMSDGLQLEEVDSPSQRTMDQVILEIQRSLDYYESHFALPPITNLVIAPLREPVPGLFDYIHNQLGINVRELEMNVLFEQAEHYSTEKFSPCFGALGAALRWPMAA
jgi:MSHA biogenesis protein MshI